MKAIYWAVIEKKPIPDVLSGCFAIFNTYHLTYPLKRMTKIVEYKCPVYITIWSGAQQGSCHIYGSVKEPAAVNAGSDSYGLQPRKER
jgi:hypothetical protein